jgi:hypothetical protein
MNEQANRRSHGLESAIRKIEIMPAHNAILAASNIDDDNDSAREASLPTDSPANSLESASTVFFVSSRANEDSQEPTLEVRNSISGQDLDDTVDQVRFLLKVLEDARSSDEDGSYQVDRQTCLESLQAIRSCLAPGTERIMSSYDSGQNQSSINPLSGRKKFSLYSNI